MVNTDSLATATFPLRDGLPEYAGDAAIDGVPGTAAAIQIDFSDIAGGSCGALLPTGNAVDVIDDGRGDDDRQRDAGRRDARRRPRRRRAPRRPAELEANAELRSRLESIRLAGRAADEPRRRLQRQRPEADAGRRHRPAAATSTHARSSRIAATRRSACSVPCRWRRRHCCPARRPHRCCDRAPIRRRIVCEHPTGVFTAAIDASSHDDGTLDVAARRHHPHRPQAVRRHRLPPRSLIHAGGSLSTTTIAAPHPAPHPPTRVHAPARRLRRALPHLRTGGPVPVLGRSRLHATRLGHRRLRAAAVPARPVAGGVRPGQLPRHRQHGDGRRPRAGRGPLRRRGDDRRVVHRPPTSPACTTPACAARASTSSPISAARPSSTCSGASSTGCSRSAGTSCCTSTPRTCPRYADLLDRMPCPYVIDHMARVPVTAGRRAGAVPAVADADGRRALLGQDLRRRAPHRRRDARRTTTSFRSRER